MIYIGNHLSTAAGFAAMGKHALALGEDTFAFFTRNPRGGKAKEIDPEDAKRLCEMLGEHGFGKLVAHAPYTMNLCSDKPEVRDFARRMLRLDLERMEYVPGNYYNFHPGSHVGHGAAAAIPMIADALKSVLTGDDGSLIPWRTTILLETMAGKGSEIGQKFEELREIIDIAEDGLTGVPLIGVCFDTCHVWDAGYDIANDLDAVLTEFDKVIGLDRLKAVHLNDSLNECGSMKDRHEQLGDGMIGLDALRCVVRHPTLQGKPFILETPNDDEGYKREVAMVRDWMV